MVGAADTRHGVASTADTQNRQLSGAIDWNDPELVRRLYSLFLGTLVIKDRPTVSSSSSSSPPPLLLLFLSSPPPHPPLGEARAQAAA